MPVSERPGEEPDNSWAAYRHMVLSTLERLDDRDNRIEGKVDKGDRRIDAIELVVAGLAVKSTVWGAAAGLIPVVIALAMILIGGYGR